MGDGTYVQKESIKEQDGSKANTCTHSRIARTHIHSITSATPAAALHVHFGVRAAASNHPRLCSAATFPAGEASEREYESVHESLCVYVYMHASVCILLHCVRGSIVHVILKSTISDTV